MSSLHQLFDLCAASAYHFFLLGDESSYETVLRKEGIGLSDIVPLRSRFDTREPIAELQILFDPA